MVRRAVLALSLLLLADPAWTQNIDGQAGGASLTVKENDNIPNVSGVSSISFTSGDGVSGNPTLSLPSSIDLGGKTLEIPHSTTLPATCGVGQIYMDTDATSGQRWGRQFSRHFRLRLALWRGGVAMSNHI